MRSRILISKTTTEIENFLYENRLIYTPTLSKFMKCSYRQAYKIIKYIKEKYKVEIDGIPSEIFRLYIENM